MVLFGNLKTGFLVLRLICKMPYKFYVVYSPQDANGSMGFTKAGFQTTPVPILTDQVIVKIASGNDHLVCLSDKGEIWSMGKFS